MFCHCLFWSGKSLPTCVTSVSSVYFIGKFFTRKSDFISIDNNYIIAAIYERSITRLMFTSDDLCYLTCKSTKYLILGIDYYPVFLYSFLIKECCFITYTFHFIAFLY